MDNMRAPSETATFGTCEIMWALEQNGWRPDRVGYPNVAMAAGTGVHAGADWLHQLIIAGGRKEGMKLAKANLASGIEIANAEACKGIESLIARGAAPIEKVEDWRERITSQVERGVKAYVSQFDDLFPQAWAINASEEAFGSNRGEGGYTGRLDLVLTDDFGPAVGDIKTKQPFKSEFYKQMFLTDFALSWQMYSYVHSLYLKGGIWPERFYLVMVELRPKPKISIHPYQVKEDFYQRWLHAAQQRWDKMDQIAAGELVPAMADNHFFYGRPCPYKRACFQHGLDEEQMKQDYIQIEGEV